MNLKPWTMACFTLAFSISSVLYATFLNAYTHGYRTVVTVNEYGEAHVELILLSILVPLISVVLVLEWVKYLKENKVKIRRVERV